MIRTAFAVTLAAARIVWLPAMLGFALTGTCTLPRPAVAQPATMPEFPEAPADKWLNSKPLTLKDLRGQVVLIEIWTST